ncbi:MAG TPA: FAD-dependent oxidoreductase [Casimicrobiaceae bacterium]|nr:FAD-dependent oxidoreductase [Casimicrobiaceae bacterium]
MKTYAPPVYPYRKPAELAGSPRRWPVIVVGAGPVGLVAAIDFAQRGVDVLLLDEDDTVSAGSRAICWSKRTLEILDRLGCGERLVEKGVGWNVGRVYFGDEQVFQFDLLPESGHRRPAFINLQQYYVEQFLVERAEALGVELRWRHRVVDVEPRADRVEARVSTPDGEYVAHADWLIAADGARSPIRTLLGLESEGQVFRDRFLIADVHMHSEFPAERRFWFDPPFHRHQSALLHRQADHVWRCDFQLGWEADPEEEKKPERVLPRVRAMLGDDVEFELEWASVYTFQCRRMRSFRRGRVLFAGDAAHLVSPFGARGANSGMQDADNLVWKLTLVLRGLAPERLLDSYDAERCPAADENIRHSTRSTDFITPKSAASRTFRDAVLALAKRHPFARRLVNSGRLSLPAILVDSPLNSPDDEAFESRLVPGAPAIDAPVTGEHGTWLLDYLAGGFTLLVFDDGSSAGALRELSALATDPIACASVFVGGRGTELPRGGRRIEDPTGALAERHDAKPGTVYLFRPDQHVCARWRAFDPDRVRAAIARATGQVRTEALPCLTSNPISPRQTTSIRS